MAKPGRGDSELAAHIDQLERLSSSYKQSYNRRDYNESEPEAYIDGLLGDMKDMRRDVMEAVRLGKRYIKSYESISHECLEYSRRYEALEEKIDELTHEVDQSSRELHHKEARIELLEHEVNASEAAFKALNMENSKLKRDIKNLQKEMETKEKQFHMKETAQENQRNQMVAEANKEGSERIDRLTKEIKRQEMEIQALFNRNKEFEAKYVNEAKNNEANKQGIAQLQNTVRAYQKQLDEYKLKCSVSEDKNKALEIELLQKKSLLENMELQKARRISTVSIDELQIEESEDESEEPVKEHHKEISTTPKVSFAAPPQLESLGDLIDEEEFEIKRNSPKNSMVFLVSPKSTNFNQMTFNPIDLTLKSFSMCNLPSKIKKPELQNFKICDVKAKLPPRKDLRDITATVCNLSTPLKATLNKSHGHSFTITPPITPRAALSMNKKATSSMISPVPKTPLHQTLGHSFTITPPITPRAALSMNKKATSSMISPVPKTPLNQTLGHSFTITPPITPRGALSLNKEATNSSIFPVPKTPLNQTPGNSFTITPPITPRAALSLNKEATSSMISPVPKTPLNQTLGHSFTIAPRASELMLVSFVICNIISCNTKSNLNKISGLHLTITPPITPKPALTIKKKCFCNIETPSTVDSPSNFLNRRGEVILKIVRLPDIYLPPEKTQVLTLNFINEDKSSEHDSAETPRRGFTRIMPADTLHWFFTLVRSTLDLPGC
jgi:hypothetical protein